jgi:UDP-N-acetylmuramoyl-L-alanyl-D-glutamate--2,6-diaminopimelate ligase
VRLAELVTALDRAGLLVRDPGADLEITGLTEDSRRAGPGTLFCAVDGSAQDGHRFLRDAARRGAAAALVVRPADLPLPQVVVRDSRAALAVAAAHWFGRPGERLTLVGVTGTNGKTTTVALIRHLLNHDSTVGSIGTVGAFDGHGIAIPESGTLTTPGAVELQATLAAFVRSGARTVVMEASSHALDQRRLSGLGLAAGVYTNLTHDHLDYHGDLSAYLAAKALLSTLIVEGGAEVVNLDDRAWRGLERRPGLRRVTYGLAAGADVTATGLVLDARATRFCLGHGRLSVPVDLPLIGEFNVSNALAAAATGIALGMDAGQIAARLAGAPQVPGRLERIVSEPFAVLRDYAHTPDALERAIAALRPLTRGRLVVLFGAGGDRDRRKRPEMGRIAARGADVAIVTSDNPRTEDPDAIIDDIEAGMNGTAHLRLVDRRVAIDRALRMAQPGDCVLLAGKGHETYQVIGTERLPFDERAIVLDALARARTA